MLNSALLEFLNTVNSLERLHIGLTVQLAVPFHRGEEEGAQTGPGAVAALLRPPARLRAAGGRLRGAGARIPLSGLGRHHGAADVQLEVRSPGCASAHAGPDQGVGVVAHFALELLKRAAHLFPEAFWVGLVPRAELRFALVLALQLGDAAPDARLGVLALHRQPASVRDVLRHPRALHLSVWLPMDEELSSAMRLASAALRSGAGFGHRVVRSAALSGGCADPVPEEEHQKPGSDSLQQTHVSFYSEKRAETMTLSANGAFNSTRFRSKGSSPPTLLCAKLLLHRHEEPLTVFVLKRVSTPTLIGTTHAHRSTRGPVKTTPALILWGSLSRPVPNSTQRHQNAHVNE